MLMNEENVQPNRRLKEAGGATSGLRRNLPYQVYKDAEVDGNVIEYEAKKIMSKEEELMKKARDLENEMLQIKITLKQIPAPPLARRLQQLQ
jgi:hypothetical protein